MKEGKLNKGAAKDCFNGPKRTLLEKALFVFCSSVVVLGLLLAIGLDYKANVYIVTMFVMYFSLGLLGITGAIVARCVYLARSKNIIFRTKENI